VNPYKGLQPYEESDQANFFGREAEKRILIDKILTHKLTFLFAASGVGKSSLLQAAVLPELKRPTRADRQPLDVVYFRDWVEQPLWTLKQALLTELQQQQRLTDGYGFEPNLSLTAFLHLATAFTSEPLVILLDQFEEFFNYQKFLPDFGLIIEQLAEAIHDRDTHTAFVISMREDFALELNAFKERMPTFLIDNFYRLEKLGVEAAKQAIVTPVERVGFSYEAGLLDILIRDLGRRELTVRLGEEKAAQLEIPPLVEPPNLQMVCTQLWELDHANPARQITRARYQQKGKAQGLLKSYFLEKIAQLSAEEQNYASIAFGLLNMLKLDIHHIKLWKKLHSYRLRNSN